MTLLIYSLCQANMVVLSCKVGPYQPNNVFLGEVSFLTSFDLVCQVFSPPSTVAEAVSCIAKGGSSAARTGQIRPVKLHQPGLVKTFQP